MAFEGYQTKDSVVVVYTGDGKGKTSASIGLSVRALGAGMKVSFVQFIKVWEVSEHKFFDQIRPIFGESFDFYKGGLGFYNAGELSAKDATEEDHKKMAQKTLEYSLQQASSGEFDLVVCDEINNAVSDGLISEASLKKLIKEKHPKTSLCLTGRNFPSGLVDLADIVSEMKKVKHHFDEKFLANKGIDF